MATAPSPTVRGTGSVGTFIMGFLTTRWVDKAFAVVGLAPFVYSVATNYQYARHDLPTALWLVDMLIIFSTVAFRKTPVRITPNPWFWALAFVATYWSFITWGLQDQGRAIAPNLLINVSAIVGTAIELWGRFSLGRNIGFVPAQRDIVVRGAYRFMRHPIYSGVFIGFLAEGLAYYSLRNLLITGGAIFWFAIKSLAEESFLKKDAAYAAYMERVRWRWFPGLI
jgi:isoprenylcysteine carboxyl methyltransferase (ICMT) family protein YpbQ